MFNENQLPAEWREIFHERAAIMEYCGNLSREDAEFHAMRWVREQMGR